jgi:hypothetical protein
VDARSFVTAARRNSGAHPAPSGWERVTQALDPGCRYEESFVVFLRQKESCPTLCVGYAGLVAPALEAIRNAQAESKDTDAVRELL